MLSSTWPERLVAYNRHSFPDSTPGHYASYRHFFIGCHDASGEFLADDLAVEITDDSYEAVLQEAVKRTAACPQGGERTAAEAGAIALVAAVSAGEASAPAVPAAEVPVAGTVSVMPRSVTVAAMAMAIGSGPVMGEVTMAGGMLVSTPLSRSRPSGGPNTMIMVPGARRCARIAAWTK